MAPKLAVVVLCVLHVVSALRKDEAQVQTKNDVSAVPPPPEIGNKTLCSGCSVGCGWGHLFACAFLL